MGRVAAISRRGRAYPDDGRRGLSLRTARVAECPNVAVQVVPAYRADNMFAPPRNHVIVIYLEDSAHLYQERNEQRRAPRPAADLATLASSIAP